MSENPYWEVVSAGNSGGWSIDDYLTATKQATVDANGGAAVTFEVPSGELWQITRATVSCTSAIAAAVEPQCRLYQDQSNQQNLLSGTNAAFYDEAEYPNDGLVLPGGASLLFVWAGAPTGQNAVARIQYRRLRRVGG